jgi:hypothetical protein
MRGDRLILNATSQRMRKEKRDGIDSMNGMRASSIGKPDSAEPRDIGQQIRKYWTKFTME